jgi:hypothetical protein
VRNKASSINVLRSLYKQHRLNYFINSKGFYSKWIQEFDSRPSFFVFLLPMFVGRPSIVHPMPSMLVGWLSIVHGRPSVIKSGRLRKVT